MSIEKQILESYRNIAVVGLSANPQKPSYAVGSYLKEQGYRIIPVNPKEEEILGEKSYPDLAAVPGPVEVVDIFRKSEDVLPIVQEAVEVGARAVWMQEGVVNEEAADYARKAGLKVVMDKCMRREHIRLFKTG